MLLRRKKIKVPQACVWRWLDAFKDSGFKEYYRPGKRGREGVFSKNELLEVVKYIDKTRAIKEQVTSDYVQAVAQGIVMPKCPMRLREFGGAVVLCTSWAKFMSQHGFTDTGNND